MTGEQFRSKYHLLDRVSTGPVETHHAQAATGAMVMVHFLRGSPQDNAAVIAHLQRLAPGHASRVLRTVEVDGVSAIITRFILDFVTFDDWLRDGVLPEPTLAVEVPVVHSPDPVQPADPPVDGTLADSSLSAAPPASV